MHHRLLAAVTVSLAFATGGVSAQDVSSFTRTTNPLTGSQQEVLERFVGNGVSELESTRPAEVMEARDEFVEVLTRLGTGPVFREAFAAAFIKDARPVLDGNDTYRKLNVLRVLAFVRTSESNLVMARMLEDENVDLESERIFIANMLGTSLRNTDPELIRPRQYNSILRSIVNGAMNERSWVALQHEFAALVAIGSDGKVPADVRTAAIKAQASVLSDGLKRIPADPQLSRAISSMILKLRTEFIGLDGLTRREFNQTVLPALVAVIGTGNEAWDVLQADPGTRAVYGDAIYQASVLARLMVGSNGAPADNPAEGWRSGDRAAFGAAAAKWASLAGG